MRPTTQGFLLPILLVVACTSAGAAAADPTVTCESHDDRWVQCPADTRGGVRLQVQLSRSPCVYGESWGYDRRGIWVDDGCRATFQLGDEEWSEPPAESWPGSGVTLLRCESRDNRNEHCPADTRGGVRLEDQLSKAPCVYGESWGYDRHGIWVSDGCRAEFSIAAGGEWEDDDGAGSGNVVVCASEGGRRSYCRADTRRGVRLDEQLSRSPCREGRTWGWDPGGVWVDDGCRGRFLLGRGGRGGHGGRGDHGVHDGDDDSDDDNTAAIVGGALVLGAVAAAVVAESGDRARDRRAGELCRGEVEGRIYRRDDSEQTVFGEETVSKEQRPIRVVEGGVRLQREGETLQSLRYRCRVNMEEQRVEDAEIFAAQPPDRR